MVSNTNVKETKAYDLIKLCKWEEFHEFITDSYEGRNEIEICGSDLIYSAIKYRAPSSLIILIFELFQRSHSHDIKLNRNLLLQALYISPKKESNMSSEICNRKWEGNELVNVADFLSNKIRMEVR